VAARVHVTGASGSGTTTLGRALAISLGVPHHDTDDAYWLPTDPPYRDKRPVPARLALLASWLDATPGWTLSGSLSGWGDPAIARFSLVVFLTAPTEERLFRLQRREAARFGAAIEPGGPQHEEHLGFIDWAGRYDDPGFSGRSRRLHEAWLAALPCPVLRLDGLWPTGRQVAAVREALAAPAARRAS
jgi:adenylate kinase family enzyme